MSDYQLTQYVLMQRQSGHSDSEIKQALLGSGYTALQVEVAFKSLKGSNPNPQLQSIVAQYLQSGMTPAQTASMLTSQGYSSSEVNSALKSCTGVNDHNHHKVTIIFIAVAIIISAALLFMLLQNNSQQQAPNGMVTTNPNLIRASILRSIDEAATVDKDLEVRNCKEELIDFSRDEVDNCILDVAIHKKVQDDALCDKIIDQKLHDTCLINFLNTPKFDSVCSRMVLVESKETCDNINALKQK